LSLFSFDIQPFKVRSQTNGSQTNHHPSCRFMFMLGRNKYEQAIPKGPIPHTSSANAEKTRLREIRPIKLCQWGRVGTRSVRMPLPLELHIPRKIWRLGDSHACICDNSWRVSQDKILYWYLIQNSIGLRAKLSSTLI
jgi:hypothetical protein